MLKGFYLLCLLDDWFLEDAPSRLLPPYRNEALPLLERDDREPKLVGRALIEERFEDFTDGDGR